MLLYADDIALFATSLEELQRALIIAEQVFKTWGMQLSHAKTEAVCLVPQHPAPPLPPPPSTTSSSPRPPPPPPLPPALTHLHLTDGAVKIVPLFKYLGSIQAPLGCLEAELTKRLAQAGAAFALMSPRYLCDRRLPLHTRMSAYKAVVIPTLLYGAAESWAPTAAQLHRLNTFNNRCLRRMLGLRRDTHFSNDDLWAVTQQPSITALLQIWRLRWLGHVVRQPLSSPTHKLVFAGHVPGYQNRAGQAPTWVAVTAADVAALGMQPGRSQDSWHHIAQQKEVWNARIARKDRLRV